MIRARIREQNRERQRTVQNRERKEQREELVIIKELEGSSRLRVFGII